MSNTTTKKTNKKPEIPEVPTFKVIKSLDEIAQLVARPFPVEFQYKGQLCEIQTRKLSPFETEILKIQLDAAMPPIIRGKTESDDRLDFMEVNYLAKKSKIQIQVRTQALFWSCPEIQERAKKTAEFNQGVFQDIYSPKHRDDIYRFVQGFLDEEIHAAIYARITAEEISIPDTVNLSSPAGA